MKKKILFIINPISGTRKKDIIPSLLERYLDSDTFEYEFGLTQYQGHARELAEQAVRNQVDCVVGVGGDGTVNEIAGGLINTNTSLGIIPTGSGNGLARHLKIPMNTAEAVKRITKQRIVRIDAGVANDKVFFCTAGMGFDAHIGKIFSTVKKRGFKTYAKSVLKEFFFYSPHRYDIKLDSEAFSEEAFLIAVANSGQYGNNAYIAPLADIKDGLLELCIIKPFPKTKILDLGLKLFQKNIHKSRYVEIKTIKEVEIYSADATCFHLDGESFDFDGRINFKVMPSCINVLI